MDEEDKQDLERLRNLRDDLPKSKDLEAPPKKHSPVRKLLPKVASLRRIIQSDDKGYVQLDLSYRNLHDIPNEVYSLVRVEALSIHNNQLEQLSSAIGQLRRLKVLTVQHNQLMILPDTLPNCHDLREIDASHNKLSSLPSNLNALGKLRILKLASNDFEMVPAPAVLLENLKILDFSSNRLWHLPSTHALHALKVLDISNNQFDHIPPCVCDMKALERLNVRGNHIHSLPYEIQQLPYLMELNLADNDFEAIPSALYAMRSLQYLNMARNRLQHLPEKMAHIPRLKTLHMQGNQLVAIPNNFENLQFLNVASNSMRNFSVAKMKSLRSLNANNNKLENMPLGVYHLPKLEIIRVNANNLRHVSQDIVMLRKLRVLDLGNNEITSLPAVIDELDNLEYFNVKGNKVSGRLGLFRKRKLENGLLMTQPVKAEKKGFFGKKGTKNETSPPSTTSAGSLPNRLQKLLSEEEADLEMRNTVPITSTSTGLPVATNNTSITIPRTNMSTSAMSPMTQITKDTSTTMDTRNKKVQVTPEKVATNQPPIQQIPVRTPSSVSAESMEVTAERENAVQTDESSTSNPDADFGLLHVAQQVETLLSSDEKSPRHSQTQANSFQAPLVVKRKHKSRHSHGIEPNSILRSKTDQFLVTGAGGLFRSSADHNIKIYFPVNASPAPLDVSLQLERVNPESIRQAKKHYPEIENVIAVGDIVRFRYDPMVDFSKEVTVTLPIPASKRQGKLHILQYMDDGTCQPISESYMTKDGYIYLQSWSWSLCGRGAVLTHAKCKYKACKSVEVLMKALRM